MTRDEQIKRAVAQVFENRRARGLTDDRESVSWIAKCVRDRVRDFPVQKDPALAELKRLGYETVDVPHAQHIRTFVKRRPE